MGIFNSDRLTPSPSGSLSERLQEFSSYTELKQLTYNIAALQQEKRFHSIAVISLYPGEGKTLATAALALTYSEICQTRVLAVDTTTFHNTDSLMLRDCLESAPRVEAVSLEDLRRKSSGNGPVSRPVKEVAVDIGPTVSPEVVSNRSLNLPTDVENDFSLLKRVTSDRSNTFGLVLLDTASLTAKNKSNVDPMLLARLSDASILVVSRKLLKAHDLNAHLKMLDDPALHLIGMIANEEQDQ